MRYTPYTEAEIQSMNVMDEGIYTFQVLEVHTTDKFNNPMQDKNGNDLAKLKLLVWDNLNRERTLFTFISGDGNFAYKLRHFAKTIGMLDDYEQGIFNINRAVGKSGTADIVIKKGTLKADGSGEMWADRNDVKDFVMPATAPALNPSVQPQPVKEEPLQVLQSDELDDDVPFN
jgi:hypothetical protein